MALRLLGGAPIDIHCGGVDLIFPHHENEIAQAEGAADGDTRFARCWFHVEHLLMDDGEKMSKSLGNVYTVQDIVNQGYRASALRYLLLSVHYRKQLKFSWAILAQAEESLKRLTDFVARLARLVHTTAPGAAQPNAMLQQLVADTNDGFKKEILSDLNISGALGRVFDMVRIVNAAIDAGEVGPGGALLVRQAVEAYDQVLGVLSLRRAEEAAPPVPVAEIDRLIEERHAARRSRNFARADEIRKDLDARGILLEDSSGATHWKRK
jgi:cysteinyl-tRNA synthetase